MEFMQAFYISFIGLLPGLPPGGFEEGAVEDEAGLVLLVLSPGVVEGRGLVGGVLPPEDELPPDVGWVVGASVLPDVVLLPAGVVWPSCVELGAVVGWAPPVELGAGVVWEPPVELGAGALVGPMAVIFSYKKK